MPKPFARVNVVMEPIPGYDVPVYYAQIEEWRSYVTGDRWEGAYTIAHGDNEIEVRKQAAKLLREWARLLELKEVKP
jgi:hypothetical protein